MDKTAKTGLIMLGVIFVLSIAGNVVAFYRESTVAQVIASSQGYQQCVNEVNTKYTLTPKEEPKPVENGTKK